MVHWTGPGRTALDRIAPFSLYRTITGSAFLFVALEFLAAGLDLNDRAFEDLKRHASPYARHRIGAIQRGMARGAGLGRAMALAGHGFPDPAWFPSPPRSMARPAGRTSSPASSSAGWAAPKTCSSPARRC